MRRGTTKAADYWALGVLIFEMLVGDPPFKSLTGDPWDTFRRTLSGRFYVPNFISDQAADLIFKLLQVGIEGREVSRGCGRPQHACCSDAHQLPRAAVLFTAANLLSLQPCKCMLGVSRR